MNGISATPTPEDKCSFLEVVLNKKKMLNYICRDMLQREL